MTRIHKTVDSLQSQLKGDILGAINGTIANLCTQVVQDNVRAKGYIPNDNTDYDRTWELLNSVTVGNLTVGYKYATFEVFMDTEKIGSYVTEGNDWNQHASVDPIDVSEYIPLWVEEGTSGSLYDREGGHYMEFSTFELGDGRLAKALEKELRAQGWKITTI